MDMKHLFTVPRLIYAAVGGGAILLYGAGEVQGWETASDRVQNVNRGPNVRSAPGGYRTWVYWHGGYRRGK